MNRRGFLSGSAAVSACWPAFTAAPIDLDVAIAGDWMRFCDEQMASVLSLHDKHLRSVSV